MMRIRGATELSLQLEMIAIGTSLIFEEFVERIVPGARAVPMFVCRTPSRLFNLDVVIRFFKSDARFVFTDNEQVPNGVTTDGRYRGGIGLTMFQWLHVPGFLEIVIRWADLVFK